MAGKKRDDRPRRPHAAQKEVWRLELERGIALLARGDAVTAELHLHRAFEQAPERPEVCLALGRERLRQGHLDQGERLLRAAWAAEPRLAAAGAALARCLGVRRGRYAEAHAVLDDATAQLGSEPGLLVVRAELLLEEVRGDEARTSLEAALALLDENDRPAPATRSAIAAGLARVYNLDGIRLGNGDRPEEALFAFKRAFDLAPTWSGPLVNMGAAFARLGRSARARQCYEQALVIEPENPVARYNLAHLARERGDLATAEAGYRKLLALAPDYPGGRIALSEVLLARGSAGDVVALYDATPPRGPADHFQLGLAHDELGDLVLAETAFRKALALDRDHVPSCCRLARLLARDGRYLEAADLVRRARARDPERAAAFLGE